MENRAFHGQWRASATSGIVLRVASHVHDPKIDDITLTSPRQERALRGRSQCTASSYCRALGFTHTVRRIAVSQNVCVEDMVPVGRVWVGFFGDVSVDGGGCVDCCVSASVWHVGGKCGRLMWIVLWSKCPCPREKMLNRSIPSHWRGLVRAHNKLQLLDKIGSRPKQKEVDCKAPAISSTRIIRVSCCGAMFSGSFRVARYGLPQPTATDTIDVPRSSKTRDLCQPHHAPWFVTLSCAV